MNIFRRLLVWLQIGQNTSQQDETDKALHSMPNLDGQQTETEDEVSEASGEPASALADHSGESTAATDNQVSTKPESETETASVVENENVTSNEISDETETEEDTEDAIAADQEVDTEQFRDETGDPALETAPIRYVPDSVTRPLPSDPIPSYQPRSGHLTFGQSSDRGMARPNNQDAALSFFFTSDSSDGHPDFGLFIVADGMGGHHDGEKASALTTRIVAAQIIDKIYLPILSGTGDHDADQPTMAEALTAAVQQANADVLQIVPEGGTTLTAMIVMGNLAHIAHVGDSRAYVITEEGIEQVTRDHSLVQRLIELKRLTPEESASHPQKNVLYRAVGQSAELEVDTLTRRLRPASRVLICSDGLWGAIDEKAIFEVVSSTPDPQKACDKLVALANTEGGHDNITVILLKLPD